jgi:hypothetical protein
MAKLTSRKANAKRWGKARVDAANAELQFSRSNDPATHEPKTYFISITGRDDLRSFDLELSPEEWERMVNVWIGREKAK